MGNERGRARRVLPDHPRGEQVQVREVYEIQQGAGRAVLPVSETGVFHT